MTRQISSKRRLCAAFTPIGLDHTDILGPTIEHIAGHKSGIMKAGVPAISVAQEQSARKELEKEASILGCDFQFIDTSTDLPVHYNVRLAAQKMNASLAIQLANAFLRRSNHQLTPEDILAGISNYTWPGRFHQVHQGSNGWFRILLTTH